MMSVHVDLSPTCSIVGTTSHAKDSHTPIFNFRGIPYAAPPVGPLRFQPPEPIALWEGVHDGKHFGPICIQDLRYAKSVHFMFSFPENMSEDCLSLNIWSPSLNKEACLPVMVYIHGGSFLIGTGEVYDGTALCTLHGVIVVTINYRLGLLGFLFNEAAGIRGNMGLLDQIAALKWVQKNIRHFGGDANNVTVFGESAGAISIASLVLSPLATGLFHRAICQSGTMLYPSAAWTPTQANKYWLKRLQAKGLSGDHPSVVKSFLSNLDPYSFVESIKTSCHVIDGSFLPAEPKALMTSKRINPVPLLIGFNQCEGYDFMIPIVGSEGLKSLARAREIIEFLVTKAFFRGLANSADVIQLLMKEYVLSLGDATEDVVMEALVHLYGDLLFVAPSLLQAELQSDVSPTYVYEFAHRLSVSTTPSWCLSKHGEEIPFVFGEPFLDRFPDGIWSEDEKRLSRLIMASWAAFAKHGDPNNNFLPAQWSKFEQEKSYCHLTASPSVLTDRQSRRMDFWNNVIPGIITGKHKL